MDMQGGPVGELLDVAVKRSTLDQLEVNLLIFLLLQVEVSHGGGGVGTP